MFKDLKKSIMSHFDEMQSTTLFTVEVDKDKIYQLYLDGFDNPDIKQEHTCNCCKSFLRQFAGIVTIVDNKVVSIWDNIQVPKEYTKSISNLKKYIHSLPIHSIFLYDSKNCGTDKNLDVKDDVIWEHFFIQLTNKFIKNKNDIPTLIGTSVTNKNVLKRALDEITNEALDLTLELIDQNSLYRGKEFEANLREFLKVKKIYDKIKQKDKDLFCWVKSVELSGALINIRNSSIGTLLLDLSADMDLDVAVTRFEKVVAPTNYKRPVSLVTPKMVEQAKSKLSELGLLDSLDRRYATSRDISIENLLFIDKSSEIQDVFDEVSKDTKVDPKTLSKVEEISIDDFINKVLPKSKSIEVLVENRHLSNFTSIITAQNNSPSLFKWDNDFSWSYTGGITDAIKERVKAAGGNVTGILRCSLAWSNHDDLDIHCIEPNKNEIYFGNKNSSTSGKLDVDMNAGYNMSKNPVENIIWTNINSMREGNYKIFVHNFSARETNDQGFTIQIEYDGEIFEFYESKNPRHKSIESEIQFNWSNKTGIKFKSNVKSNTTNKEKWGLKTNTFTKVKQAMLSPNYWNNKIGNKHYIFTLENCISDENPRPFFNEFLKQDLDKHRKVLETVASKLKIKEDQNQLSGLGFSETQKNSIIVRVQGAFKRVMKVNF